MKTILLASEGTKIIDEILKIIPKPHQKQKLVYIYTAANHKGYKDKKGRDIPAIKKAGFKIYFYDFEGKKQKQIEKYLENKDIIWVRGGNTFYLLKAAQESGFNKAVKKLINKGKIYIGTSAGSYIACPTIEMAYWKRQDRNIVDLKNLKAMSLVPFLIFCHYSSKYKTAVKKGIKESKFKIRILTDDQAILVQGKKISLVGKGKEIKL